MSEDMTAYFRDPEGRYLPTVYACPQCGELKGGTHVERGGCPNFTGSEVYMHVVGMHPKTAELLRAQK